MGGVWRGLMGCGGVLCVILSGAKDLGDTSSLLTSNRVGMALFLRGVGCN